MEHKYLFHWLTNSDFYWSNASAFYLTLSKEYIPAQFSSEVETIAECKLPISKPYQNLNQSDGHAYKLLKIQKSAHKISANRKR